MGSTASVANRKRFVALGASLVAALALSACWSGDQRTDQEILNRDRAANGRAALGGDQQVMDKAQAWSAHMARIGTLEHSGGGGNLDPSGISGWCALAENVGYGSSIGGVRASFMGSAAHRANTLGDFDLVGTGVALSNGTYWVTEIYKRSC